MPRWLCAPSEGGAEHARGPGLTFVSLAGNVLHVAVEAVVVALLTKSACFLKAASRDRCSRRCWPALGRADRRLGAALAVAWWPGGDTEFEAAATAAAGAVIAYGSAAAVESLRARVPAGARFVAHGPKVSLAVVEAGSCTWDTARALALDISVYDQQGCVAPHTVYVVSDSGAAARFAGLLAGAMATVQAELPAGRLGAADAVAIQQARGAAEFAPGAAVHAPNGGAEWTVVFEPAPDFRGSCLNRVVYVKPLSDLGALPGAVHSVDGLVQTVGVAGSRIRRGRRPNRGGGRRLASAPSAA
ncbi:MAG: acyl-CoA reductase [Dehalococcoidia bacterium]